MKTVNGIIALKAKVVFYAHLRGIPAPSTIASAMKKFLLIFMLLMLPLQASWGVVSEYCQPDREICVEACYSDDQEQRVYSSDETQQTSSNSVLLDQYEHTCHAPAVSIISSSNQTTSSISSSSILRFQETPLSLPTFSERPERPQWLFLA